MTLTLFLLSSSLSHSQVEEWSLTTSDGRNILSVRLQNVGTDSLTFSSEHQVESIPLAKLTHLKGGKTGSSEAPGVVIGALIGGSFGYLTGKIIEGSATKQSQHDQHEVAVPLTISGTLVGGLVGYLLTPSSSAQEYDLTLRSVDEKQAIFDSLIMRKKFPAYPYSRTRDVIVLKDSSLLKGKIVRPLADGRNTIVVGENSLERFEMSDVARIYEERTGPVQEKSAVQPPSDGQTASARDEPTTTKPRPIFRLHGGLALPLGNFSESSGGGANPGFAVGAGMNLSQDGISGWFTTIEYVQNSVNLDEVKGLYPQYRIEASKWTNWWMLSGMRLGTRISSGLELAGTLQIGALFSSSPSLTVTGNGINAFAASWTQNGFAFGCGAECIVKEHFVFCARFENSEAKVSVSQLSFTGAYQF